MKKIGIALVLIGLALLVMSLRMETAVLTKDLRLVQNIGLLQQQSNFILISCAISVVGAIAFLFSISGKKDSSTLTKKVNENFTGEKNLSSDSYKLYLTQKYSVAKDEVFNKYVFDGKMYDDLDALLETLNLIEQEKETLKNHPISTMFTCTKCGVTNEKKNMECWACGEKNPNLA